MSSTSSTAVSTTAMTSGIGGRSNSGAGRRRRRRSGSQGALRPGLYRQRLGRLIACLRPCLGRVDGHVGAGADAQRLVGVWRARDPDPHGEALGDLDPVAGGILRRQHREGRARAGADALDHAVEVEARIHVEADGRRLARLDAGEIGFLEVGVDPPIAVLDEGEGGVPAWTTLPGRSRTLETQPVPGAATWVFTRSWVALSSCAAAARSLHRGRGHRELLVSARCRMPCGRRRRRPARHATPLSASVSRGEGASPFVLRVFGLAIFGQRIFERHALGFERRPRRP